MKKLHVVLMALVAVFAFSAVAANSASAEATLLADWLINGVAPLTLTSVQFFGILLLKDTKTGTDIHCSGVLDGSVGPSGETEITEVLSLAGAVVNLTTKLKCEGLEVCEKTEEGTNAAPEELPFHGLLYLMETTGEFLFIVFKAKYFSECLVLKLPVSEECTSTNGVGKVQNGVVTAEPVGPVEPLGACTEGGAGSGLLEPQGEQSILSLTGEPVTVSSEP
jgi:hypothetical protein